MLQTSSSGYPTLLTAAVTRVLANEGGYSRVSNDPGGETNLGISYRDYPELEIGNLTRDGAVAIYFRDFRSAGRYAELPKGIAIKLFDLSVDMGPAHGAGRLQRALRACGSVVVEDGALGNATVAAANRVEGGALLAALRSEAASHCRATAELSQQRGAGNRVVRPAGSSARISELHLCDPVRAVWTPV